jgi:hypothetical protein
MSPPERTLTVRLAISEESTGPAGREFGNNSRALPRSATWDDEEAAGVCDCIDLLLSRLLLKSVGVEDIAYGQGSQCDRVHNAAETLPAGAALRPASRTDRVSASLEVRIE